MQKQHAILAFAGSTRKDSYNIKLVKIAAKAAEKAGTIVTYIDLKDYEMPIYNADFEQEFGIPQKALEFKQLLKDNQGFLIASPEYNSSVSPLLKNAIDWATRQEPQEKPLECFQDKLCILLSASPGKLGGLRGLTDLRKILSSINVIVLPDQFALSNAMEAFDGNDNLKDQATKEEVNRVGVKLASYLNKIYG